MRNRPSYISCILLTLSAVFLMSSCAGVDIPDAGGHGGREYPVLLSTSCAGTDTRITHDGTSMAWEEDDVLHMTAIAADGTAGSSDLTFFRYLADDDKHGASFSGFVTMTSLPEDCYFVYPKLAMNSIDPETGLLSLYYNNQSGAHEPVMYAYAPYSESGISETLVHVGAMLEVDVQIEGVVQITFVGNRLENLSPAFVDTSTGNVTVGAETSSNVQITVPVQTEGKTYIAVPPVNFERGFSLVCSNEDASVSMIKTFSTDGGASSGYDFSAKVGQIIPVSLTGTLTGYSVTCSDPVVSHTRKDGLLYETSVTFSMNKQGASDKIIEEWGANLIKNRDPLDPDSKNIVVRTVSYTNEHPIVSDASVAMNKVDGWPLLPAGEYTFAPYYKIYGQEVSLTSRTITIDDPGITLEISGQTSYDKYLAGNIDGTGGANAHANNLIQGVSVSTNVHLDVISSYAATLDGADMSADLDGITSGTSVVASYGDLTKTSFKAYPMVATLAAGGITVTANRTFHLTGLPYEADFTTGNPFSDWSPAWDNVGGSMKYSDGRVNFPANATSSIRTPVFYIPSGSVKVKTSVDACSNATQEGNRTISILNCSSSQGSTAGTSSIVSTYHLGFASGFGKKGYIACPTVYELSDNAPCLMYTSTTSALYMVGFFMAKIEYSN